MNAQELFLKNGKSAGVFYCEKCKVVHRQQADAEQCCKPNICACGATVDRLHYTVCDSCIEKREAQKEADLFDKAEKVSDRPCFYNDKFYNSVSDLKDDLEVDAWPEDLPKYVWATKPVHFVKVDLADICERISEDAYDDFDSDKLFGIDELAEAIKEFNNANFNHILYEPDYTKAIIIADQN